MCKFSLSFLTSPRQNKINSSKISTQTIIIRYNLGKSTVNWLKQYKILSLTYFNLRNLLTIFFFEIIEDALSYIN